jgi:hypothetical protein
MVSALATVQTGQQDNRSGREKIMGKKLGVIGTLVAVLGLVLGTAALTSASTARPAGKIIHLSVHFIKDSALDLGAHGPSQGDEMILHDLLFSQGKQVGHDEGVCVLTDVAAQVEICMVTFALPDGEITTQFLNSPPPAKRFAVTGGTGSYRNMRGQGELVESPNQTATLTFNLIG